MYNKHRLQIEPVVFPEQIEEMYTVVNNIDVGYSPFTGKITKGLLTQLAMRTDVVFLNVYYEKKIIGYMFLQYRSSYTVDIHWGTAGKVRYAPPIIVDCFKYCKKLGIRNFLGTIPVSNTLSYKIAVKKMGFKKLTTINNYMDNGESVHLVQHEV